MILLATAYSGQARGTWSKEQMTARNAITPGRLATGISFLSDTLCGGRATGSKGSIEAAFWIERQFSESGLIPLGKGYGKSFRVADGRCAHNIIGMLPGSLTVPRDRYIIVGAHYDHLGKLGGSTYPGADANASGTMAMVSLARMFSQMRQMGKVYNSNIIFVAFDAKEQDLAGSEELWDMISGEELINPLNGHAITRSKISLMVNIDQIGSTLAPISKEREDYMIMLGTPSLKHGDRGRLEKCNIQYGTDLEIGLDYYGSHNFTKIFYRLSDQRVFVDNRIPAVLFTSGITMNNNKTRDTASTLDMDILKRRLDLMFHWIEEML